MLQQAYKSPFRVYLCFALLALLGIAAGFNLPVSLYPNTNRPTISAGVNFGGLTSKEFLENYGFAIESALKNIQNRQIKSEKVTAEYNNSNVEYTVDFGWGVDPKEALREVETIMNSKSGQWPKEVRDSLWVNFWSRSSGFVAISFYSSKRSLSEIYDVLNPEFFPRLQALQDAQEASLWNPEQKEIRLTLNSEMMALHGLFPRDVENAIADAKLSLRAGKVELPDSSLQIQVPRELNSVEDLKSVLVRTPEQKLIPLKDIAQISLENPSEGERVFKTSGNKSLILFATPKSGANVKRLAEDILKISDEVMTKLPEQYKDIQFKVLVDPSEFIRNSVNNVFKEVFLAAFLAVIVLFLFVGNIQNTITAALEIPLSMILAFILMKVAGININLISLGGLALSAGMNVDASVVVMENIFVALEKVKHRLTPREANILVYKAVKQVIGPVIGSTIASLVVFLPLALTKDLTNAVLGDLALTVVFSHGLSAIVALFLVPTIRLHLINLKGGIERVHHAPIEKPLKHFENFYASLLDRFLNFKILCVALPFVMMVLLAGLLYFGIPKLPKEIIGMPDTDWIILGVNTVDTNSIKAMENTTDEIEDELLQKFGAKVDYTFVQVQRKNNGTIMARLKDKRDMEEVWKKLEAHFKNTPTLRYFVVPWNPAELPLPNPPSMEISIKGGEVSDRALLSRELVRLLDENEVYPNVWDEPSGVRPEGILFHPHQGQLIAATSNGARLNPLDIADMVRVYSEGRSAGFISEKNKTFNIAMDYSKKDLASMADLGALPLKLGEKIIPLAALGKIERREIDFGVVRTDNMEITKVIARVKKGDEQARPTLLAKAKAIIAEFQKNDLSKLKLSTAPTIFFEDADHELTKSIEQLLFSIGISIALIFFALYMQFGSVVQTLIILSAIPTGLIGVVISLLAFKSTLSLNSSLGVILLNGITVANSIMLVDLTLELVGQGYSPKEAAILAARRRLRPILITSLTTILGMIPIALGMGEGGKILAPLGVAVAGGLWFSMIFTLFVVPGLEILVLKKKEEKYHAPEVPEVPKELPNNEDGHSLWQ